MSEDDRSCVGLAKVKVSELGDISLLPAVRRSSSSKIPGFFFPSRMWNRVLFFQFSTTHVYYYLLKDKRHEQCYS